jgi:protein-tyrosine kinase
MDKVQAAIAKARAARNEIAGGVMNQTQPSHAGLRTADARGRSFDANGPASSNSRAAFWQPLATFVPPAKLMVKNRIVTYETGSQKDVGIVAFDMLRTKVLLQMRANGWKRLAITSPGANCGKTTVSMNLAFSLARQAEVHTIVSEMDMRRPSMAKVLSLTGDTSFSAVLDGRADFADIARRPRPNLAFALNYRPTRNSSELLQSSTMGQVLSSIEKRFAPDLMIFDMPPMLQSDDTMAFMGQVDCVLLVAAAESTTLGEIDTCERDLATQTNVMGVLLNKCRYLDKDSGVIGTYY